MKLMYSNYILYLIKIRFRIIKFKKINNIYILWDSKKTVNPQISKMNNFGQYYQIHKDIFLNMISKFPSVILYS